MKAKPSPSPEPSHFNVMAQSWMDWARSHSKSADYSMEASQWLHGQDLQLLGMFIQASAEKPDEFERIFSSVLQDGAPNPLTASGAGTLMNLVRNGVFDDWEIYLQWREEGYAVVPEGMRKPQDAPLTAEVATRLLLMITGGQRMAPGEADEGALLQSMYEMEPSHRHRPA